MADITKYEGRIDEDYILTQYQSATKNESHRAHKTRIEEFKRVYRGDWLRKFPDGNTENVKPIIENLAKNAIHDLAGLAHSARSMVTFMIEGDSDDDEKKAAVRNAIADTHWEMGNGRRMEKRLYMDMIGAGMAVVAASKVDGNDYPVLTRLDPANCYPDSRNGVLRDLVYTETVRLRSLFDLYGLPVVEMPAWAQDEGKLVEYYGKTEVVRAVIAVPTEQQAKNHSMRAWIVERWEHKLDCIPVGFIHVDSFDGAFRGLLDQSEGALTARNDIVQYLQDYIESMVHAPFRERGVMNPEDLPGPFTVYHEDTTIQDTRIDRVPPAAPAGAVFGLVQYLEDQASGETVQPPARQGTVQQSIASGSFVNSTQGRLTTVIEELQDMMADLRKSLTYITFEVDEQWLNYKKPMIRAIQKQRTYKPSTDISGKHYCEIEFGAMRGLNKLDADVRVLNHLGAGLISRQVARRNIDYLGDTTRTQDEIDREAVHDSFVQRLITDPSIPPHVVAQVMLGQSDGKSFVEAVRDVMPALVELPTQAAGPAPAEAPEPEEAAGVPGAPVQGQIPGGGAAEPDLSKLVANKPLQQLIVRNPNG